MLADGAISNYGFLAVEICGWIWLRIIPHVDRALFNRVSFYWSLAWVGPTCGTVCSPGGPTVNVGYPALCA